MNICYIRYLKHQRSSSDSTRHPSAARVSHRTFCATRSNTRKQPRDPHDARITQHDAHQRADLAAYVRIEPKNMRWRPQASAQWPQQCMWQCMRSIHSATTRFLSTQKRVAPSAPRLRRALVRMLRACCSRCRLSTLRTHRARAKAVRSGFVSGGGVNRAVRQGQRHNGVRSGSPAAERARDRQFKRGFQL